MAASPSAHDGHDAAEKLQVNANRLWTGGVATAVVAALVAVVGVEIATKVATAAIFLAIGVAIGSLVSGVASSAVRLGGEEQPPAG